METVLAGQGQGHPAKLLELLVVVDAVERFKVLRCRARRIVPNRGSGMVGGPRYQGVAAGGASDFPGAMLDGIAGAVVLPADRRLRAAAIAGLVDELLKALVALHDPDLEVEEIASLQRVAAAAHAHLTRMNVVNSAGGKG